jgi:hypothetical protein
MWTARRGAAREQQFSSASVLQSAVELYVVPSLLEQVFGLKITVDIINVQGSISSATALPADEEFERRARRALSQSSQSWLPTQHREKADTNVVRYERTWHVLNGGFLAYSLAAVLGKSTQTYSYSAQAFLEALGGDLQVSLLGAATNGDARPPQASSEQSWLPFSFRWDYALNNSPYLTHIRVGHLLASGIRQASYLGVQVSNEPLKSSASLGTFLWHGLTRPRWEVEAYLNSQYLGVVYADSVGRFSLEIPLLYGSALLQLRYFGQTGERYEETHRVQVPASFTPPGEVRYALSIGKMLQTNQGCHACDSGLTGILRVSTGLTSWLSTQAVAEYSASAARWLLSGSVLARLGTSTIVSLEATPEVAYRATVSSEFGASAYGTLFYAAFPNSSLALSGGKTAQIGLIAGATLDALSMPWSFRVAASRDTYLYSAHTFHLHIGANTSLLGVRMMVDARGFLGSQPSLLAPDGMAALAGLSATESSRLGGNLTVSAAYPITIETGLLSILNGVNLSLTSNYQFSSLQWSDLRVDVSRNLWTGARLRYIWFRDFTSEYSSSSLQLSVDVAFLRSVLSVQHDALQTSYAGNVQGSVAFDAPYGKTFFGNTAPNNTAAASVRVFLDKNGNGRFDATEEVLKNASVLFKQSVLAMRSDDGITRVRDLVPYSEYEVSLDESSLDNPLYVPRSPSMVFVAEPNGFKAVDIPMVVAGVVSGTVRLVRTSLAPNTVRPNATPHAATPTATVVGKQTKQESVSGMSIHLTQQGGTFKKTVNTFSDGTYYVMGVPPGRYTASIDTAQIKILRAVCEQPTHEFTVNITHDGDLVENIDFLLTR